MIVYTIFPAHSIYQKKGNASNRLSIEKTCLIVADSQGQSQVLPNCDVLISGTFTFLRKSKELRVGIFN